MRFGLVQPTLHFTGRDELLDRLAAGFAVERSGPVVQVLCGLGGVGKTNLAAGYVAAHHGEFAIIAWIRSEQDPAADLGALADRLVTVPAAADLEERAQRAIEHLASTARRWLLVFDNAEDPAKLRSFIPTSGRGGILITTRSQEFHRLGRLVPVGEFDRETAVRYLRSRAPASGGESAARELAEALGCLPLALGHAGSYCATGTSFEDYLAFLDGLPARELFAEDPAAGHEQTVASTWQPSIAAAGRQSRLAPVVLGVAAYLAPEGIPVDLFRPLTDQPGTIRGRKQLADALNALARYSLIERAGDTFAVHRLLQRIIREEHADAGDTEPCDRVVTLLDAALPAESEDPATWPAFRLLLPHVTATLTQVTGHEAPSCARHVELLIRTARYLANAAAPDPALALTQAIADYAGEHLGARHRLTLVARADVARSYWRTGLVADAIDRQESVLRDQERLLGPDHPDTLQTRHLLASSYRTAGRIGTAIALQEEVLADRLRVHGPDDMRTISTRHNLAISYGAATRIDEAIALGEQVLADRRRVLGPDHPQTLDTRHNVAIFYRAAGRHADAVATLGDVLVDRERILGTDHPHTLATRHNLAHSLYLAGRTDEAGALARRVLDERRLILGPGHPETVATRELLASWAVEPDAGTTGAAGAAGAPDDAVTTSVGEDGGGPG